MLVKALILGLFLNLVNGAYTDKLRIYKHAPLVVQSVEDIIQQTIPFFDSSDTLGFCNVLNQPALGTVTHALTQLNSPKAIDYFIKQCNDLTGDFTRDTFDRAYNNATKYLTDYTAGSTFKPASYPDTLILSNKQTYLDTYINFNYGVIFGIALDCYWFVMIFLSGFWKLLKFAAPGLVKKFTGGFINTIRKYITLPALFGKTHNEYYYLGKIYPTLFPTRLESLMVVGYVILVLVFNVTNFHHLSNSTMWPVKSSEMGKKIADRISQQLLFTFPLLILFPGRNNFLQFVTNWKYSTFIVIHKWIARMACVLALSHGVCMTLNGKGANMYSLRNHMPYVRWGMVSITALFTTSFVAMGALRKVQYELFVLVHVLLAAIIMAGTWIHTRGAGNYEQFIICAVSIWAFDRVVRIARMVSFGIKNAKVELIAKETLKVTVKTPSFWRPFPGAHGFVYFLRPTTFWQSHPFTIVKQVNEKNTITFFIKVKGGMTHGLYKFLNKAPGQKAYIPITVEGPYGNRLPLDRYDNNVFIGSGNGVPGLYDEARQLLASNKSKSTIKFIWIIRHYKTIEWFYQELLNLKLDNIDITIYVTNGTLGIQPFWNDTSSTEVQAKSEHSNLDNEKIESIIDELKANLSHISFKEGRPNIDELVNTEIIESTGSLAIATCCYSSIDDQIRKSVANGLDKTKNRVDLFDQNQVW